MLRLVRLLLLLPPSTSRVTTASVLLLLSPVGSVAGLPAVWLVALLLPLLLGLALGWWAVAAGAALCRQQAQVGSQFLFVAVLKTGLLAVPPMQPGLPAHEDRHIVGLGFEEEADFKPLACCLCADRFRSSECICMCSFSDCQQHGPLQLPLALVGGPHAASRPATHHRAGLELAGQQQSWTFLEVFGRYVPHARQHSDCSRPGSVHDIVGCRGSRGAAGGHWDCHRPVS